jgi:hypothetical protein
MQDVYIALYIVFSSSFSLVSRFFYGFSVLPLLLDYCSMLLCLWLMYLSPYINSDSAGAAFGGAISVGFFITLAVAAVFFLLPNVLFLLSIGCGSCAIEFLMSSVSREIMYQKLCPMFAWRYRNFLRSLPKAYTPRDAFMQTMMCVKRSGVQLPADVRKLLWRYVSQPHWIAPCAREEYATTCYTCEFTITKPDSHLKYFKCEVIIGSLFSFYFIPLLFFSGKNHFLLSQ